MTNPLFNILIQKGLYECHSYKSNDIIKYQNTSNFKKIYLIRSGIVKVGYLKESGEDIITVLLKENQCFGTNQVYDSYNYNYTLESISTETVIYTFEIKVIKLMIQEKLILQKEVFQIIGQEYNILEKRIKTLQCRFVEKRLMATIEEFIEKFEVQRYPDSSICIFFPLNQEELANYIRASRVIINKVINDLKHKSMIEHYKNKMVLKKSYLEQLNNKYEL